MRLKENDAGQAADTVVVAPVTNPMDAG